MTRSEWIADLRSGKFRQVSDELTRDGGFCCLGVGALRCGLSEEQISGYTDFSDLEGNAVIATKIDYHQLLGIDALTEACVARLNDDARLTFPQIADLLEQGNEAVQRALVRHIGGEKFRHLCVEMNIPVPSYAVGV